MSFPTDIDNFTNPLNTDKLNNPSHSQQHANLNDAVEALETKVGADSSAVTTSHDYKLSGVTGTDKAVSKTGSEVLTNKTLTTPKVDTSINDTNDNEVVKLGIGSASAVNEVTITNSATGSYPRITATGDDTDIVLRLSGKGAQSVRIYSGDHAREVVRFADVASSVNFHFIYGGPTGSPVVLAAAGSDSNIGINLVPKGTGTVQISGEPISGAWTDYTPSISGSGSALGNGTVTGSYAKIGRTVHCKAKFTLGSTSTVGASLAFSLPFTANTDELLVDNSIIGTGSFFDASTTNDYMCDTRLETSTAMRALVRGGANGIAVATSSTVPFTWTTSDIVTLIATYEASS